MDKPTDKSKNKPTDESMDSDTHNVPMPASQSYNSVQIIFNASFQCHIPYWNTPIAICV